MMLEAKAKDLALLRLREQLAARGFRPRGGRRQRDHLLRRDGDFLRPNELTAARGTPARSTPAHPPPARQRAGARRLAGRRIAVEVLRRPARPARPGGGGRPPGRNVEARAGLPAHRRRRGAGPGGRLGLRRGEDPVAVAEAPPPPAPSAARAAVLATARRWAPHRHGLPLPRIILGPGPRDRLDANAPTSGRGRADGPARPGARRGRLGQRRGAAPRLPALLFINAELTVHLAREPAGEWVCLDAVTRPGTLGVGLAEAVLSGARARLGPAPSIAVRARRGEPAARSGSRRSVAAAQRARRDPRATSIRRGPGCTGHHLQTGAAAPPIPSGR